MTMQYHQDLAEFGLGFDKGEVWAAIRALINGSALNDLVAISERSGLVASVVYEVVPLRDPSTFSTTEYTLWKFVVGVASDQPVDLRWLAQHFNGTDEGVRIMTVLMSMFMGDRA